MQNGRITENKARERGTTRFAFTQYEYADDWIDRFQAFTWKRYRFQEECCPTTGRLHLQGYLETVKRTRFSEFKGFFNKIKQAVKSPWINYEYCSKVDTATGKHIHELGLWIEPRSSIRKRKQATSSEMIDDIRNYATERDIARKYPKLFLKSSRGIPLLIKHHAERTVSHDVTVILLVGSTGTGKSHWARQYAHFNGLSLYSKMVQKSADTQWFDNYDGEQVILLDDFSADQVPFRTLLTWLDIYPIQVQCKSLRGGVMAAWTTVILTSNTYPQQWYLDDTAPLERRIDHTFECNEKYCVDYVDFKTLFTTSALVSLVEPEQKEQLGTAEVMAVSPMSDSFEIEDLMSDIETDVTTDDNSYCFNPELDQLSDQDPGCRHIMERDSLLCDEECICTDVCNCFNFRL